MTEQLIKTRLSAIRVLLRKYKTDAFLLTSEANVTYITGFCGGDSWSLLTMNNSYLLTDSRYSEQAQSQCPKAKIIVRTDSMSKALGKLLKTCKSVRTITVEASVSIAEFKALKKAVVVKVKTASNIIERFRCIKDAYEIKNITFAAKQAAKALKQTMNFIKPGITETKLAGLLDLEIRKAGSVNSFETIAAFGANASMPHHQGGNKKLKTNDSVLIDFGTKHNGYCCDITRCFIIGKSTRLYTKALEVVKCAQLAAIRMVKPGVKPSDVDAAAKKVITGAGLPVYGHGTGHGLGLEVHETPVVSEKAKGELKAGMVLTIEPGIYIPGKLGIRIEDDVLVTDTGCRVLTKMV